MTPAELSTWREFYVLFPFDDLHRYHRPAALVAGTMGQSDTQRRVDAALRWLAPTPQQIPTEASANFSEADLRTMAAFGVVPPKG